MKYSEWSQERKDKVNKKRRWRYHNDPGYYVRVRAFGKASTLKYQEERKAYARNRWREIGRVTILGTLNKDGKVVRVKINKRPYPGFCEVCKKKQEKYLNYHHWDDQNPGRGVWACMTCHRIIEIFDSGCLDELLTNYRRLKGRIEDES